MMTDDMALVREYARGNSEEAFAALVSRHINLVYSVALRQVHDPHLQKKSPRPFYHSGAEGGSLGPRRFSPVALPTARYAAADALKNQRRRDTANRRPTCNHFERNGIQCWMQIAPLLDMAMGSLAKRTQRRGTPFFLKAGIQDMSAAWTQAKTAPRCGNRALEKLRKFFTKRGVTLSAAVIAGAVSANSVHAAPVGLAITWLRLPRKGRGGSFNINPCKRSIETYGLDKMKTAAVTARSFF